MRGPTAKRKEKGIKEGRNEWKWNGGRVGEWRRERKDKKDLAPRDTVLANVPRRSLLYRRPIVIHD